MADELAERTAASGEGPATQQPRTIIVTVHGTNDADETDTGKRWWQHGSDFTQQLAHELAARGIAPVAFFPVRWSGANSDFDRLQGAAGLARELRGLERQSTPYALVGHSHGGNVIMEGVARSRGAGRLGGIVSFGTPFFERRLKLVPLVIALFQVLLGVVVTPVLAVMFYRYWSWLWQNELYAKLIEPVVVLGGLGFLSAWALIKGVGTLTQSWRNARTLSARVRHGDWLVVHSPRDEAMRLLETAATLSPTYVTTAWGVRSLSRMGSLAGLLASVVFLVVLGGYLLEPIVTKLKAGEFGMGLAADMTFLLLLPVAYGIGHLAMWLLARLGGGWLYGQIVNRSISGGLVGAAYGGDARDRLVRVHRVPPRLNGVDEVRIEALNLGGIDDAAIFDSAKGLYESILQKDSATEGLGDPDMMWKRLSDALYHNAYMRDAGVIAAVAEHIAGRVDGRTAR